MPMGRPSVETSADGEVKYVSLCAVIGCPNRREPDWSLCKDHLKAWEEFSKKYAKTYDENKVLLSFAFLAQAEKSLNSHMAKGLPQ